MGSDYSEKDWRDVVDKPSKIKFEMKHSYAYAHRSRITRTTNFDVIYPGTKKERVVRNVLIVIDLKSKFSKDIINDFLSQALDYYKGKVGSFLKVKVSLFNGKSLSDIMDLSDYKSLYYTDVTNDSDYNIIIDISRRNKIDEVLIFTDNIQDDIEINVKDISVKYCFDTEEHCERASNISICDRGYFVKDNESK